MTKSSSLIITVFVCALLILSPGMRSDAKAQVTFMQGEQLFADVVKYAEMSPHLTGTKGDVATSRWMADGLKKAGLTVELQPWTLRQFFLKECSLEVNGQKVEAYPFWYPRTTGSEPVKAPLVVFTKKTKPEELAGRIVFVAYKTIGPGVYGNGINKFAEDAAKAGAKGLIVSVGSLSAEIVAINARDPYHQKPLPIPSVIISLKSEKAVAKAASEGAVASLIINGEDKTGVTAFNVVGTLKRGNKWIVVTTPTSGWFECAAERGPGVALFLELARWAAKSDSQYSYLFLGNSGHELDNIGAHYTLNKYAPSVEDVASWIHLGASISARNWVRKDGKLQPLPVLYPRLSLVGVESLMPILTSAFKDVKGFKPRSGGRIAGELRHFMKAGYRVFGFFGGHPFFHTQFDTPASTEPALLEPVGKALVEVIKAVEAEGK